MNYAEDLKEAEQLKTQLPPQKPSEKNPPKKKKPKLNEIFKAKR
jgi:hypothetical protein